MPFYPLDQFAAYAKARREAAGDTLAEAARKVTEQVRAKREEGEDEPAGEVHRSHVHRAEEGGSRYKALIRDLLLVYDSAAAFDPTPRYHSEKEIPES
jgi:hypothetical protein